MKKLIIASLMLVYGTAMAAHHEESQASVQYVLTQGFKSNDAPATAAAAAKFLESGALAKRGVGMGLYSMNANAGNAATMMIDYYYPNAKALPPANVQTASGPHTEFFGKMRDLGNENVYSTISSTVIENAPPETIGVNKVFYAYFLKVSDPAAYVAEWTALMKALNKEGIAPTGYGLREIVAGAENNETHMIWMGYPSLEALMNLYKKTNKSASVSAFQTKVGSMRTVSRTVIISQLAIDTAEMFN